MYWIAPTEKDTATVTLEKRLWDAADQFRANSGHTVDIFKQKCLMVFEHVYERYPERNAGVYSLAS